MWHKPLARMLWHCSNDNALRLPAHLCVVVLDELDVDVVAVLELDVDVLVVVVSQPLQVLAHCSRTEPCEHRPRE